jgi:hypothetical protein
MTPKQKAKELFNKYYLLIDIKNYENTKNCALIAVDEIINSCPLEPAHPYDYVIAEREAMEFWQEVKKEIDAL